MTSLPSDSGSVPVKIVGIRTHVPEQVLTNSDLAAQITGWTEEKIFEKTGIRERRIAGADETALDLAHDAARKLLDSDLEGADSIDFLILCTQAPDYILPTSACILQDRLGLPTSVGAFDMNLGCSGYVYGLSVAAGLIASGAARRILLVTADTYSKYIHPLDKSVRTLFGDGATATLISAADPGSTARVGPFLFGSDGSGARHLIVEAGGFRLPRGSQTGLVQEDRSGNVRSKDNLYMNGAEVLSFTLREVPKIFRQMLEKTGETVDDFDYIVMHQANKFMLDALQKKLRLPAEKVPRCYETIGNTVSSSIPFLLTSMGENSRLRDGARIMLIGFGVGLSWAAAAISL